MAGRPIGHTVPTMALSEESGVELKPERPRVVVAGGGVAGVEAALALVDLAGELAEITLVSPEQEFHYKPLTVEEPFTMQPAARFDLDAMLGELGVAFVREAVSSVDPENQRLLVGGSGDRRRAIGYDKLVTCIGGRARPIFREAETFWAWRGDLPIDDLIKTAASEDRELRLLIPPGTSWPLPMYELALLTRRRSEELRLGGVPLHVYTPEDAPLLIFGPAASAAVGDVLRARRIELSVGASVVEDEDGALRVHPGGALLEAGPTIALPRIEGPAIAGLPADEHGFVPIDGRCRVRGVPDVYAAGDGTDFPVKQGGLASQQADVAAEQIAAELGAEIEPHEFEPVLRGKLITGDESLHLKHELSGGHGEGMVSADYLWWPPQKIGGRYLSALLGHEPVGDLEPTARALEVEVSLPHEWHGELLTWDSEIAPR